MINSWCKRTILTIISSIGCALFFDSGFAAPSAEGIQVYQKNMHLSEERKQSLANDIRRYHNADNMWDELRDEFTLPHYEDSPQVQQQIQWFLNHPDFLMHSATRAAPYLYYILQQVRKRHLPAETVLLPMIESAYNPFAYSTAGAAGIWQMMPGTASGYGIKQDWWYDGRRDVVASTKAALDYLVYLGSFFDGNWLLAIAAYDTGEGNVLSAIRKNYRSGINTDFWSLPVAQETREYVPRLLALATIISNPYKYPINFPPVKNAPYLAQVDIGGQIDLKQAAYLAGLNIKDLMQLNPGFNRTATAPNGPFKLVLPIEHVQQFTENLSYSPQYQQINWIHYKIKSGDTLKSIARKFDVSPTELHKVNPKFASGFKPGKSLLIPRSSPAISRTVLEPEPEREEQLSTPADFTQGNYASTQPVNTSTKIAKALEQDFQSPYALKPGDTLYMVRRGDNLKKIADHFHMTTKALLAVNDLRNPHLEPGTQLIIPTHSPQETPKYQLSAGDTIYMVRRGDTVEKIAQKFHISPANIRITNLLASNDVQEGDRLIIPTHG